jgi:hypothetical protein
MHDVHCGFKWKVEGGRWKVEGGRWKVEGGRWKVEGGRWKVEGGRWKVEVVLVVSLILIMSLFMCVYNLTLYSLSRL